MSPGMDGPPADDDPAPGQPAGRGREDVGPVEVGVDQVEPTLHQQPPQITHRAQQGGGVGAVAALRVARAVHPDPGRLQLAGKRPGGVERADLHLDAQVEQPRRDAGHVRLGASPLEARQHDQDARQPPRYQSASARAEARREKRSSSRRRLASPIEARRRRSESSSTSAPASAAASPAGTRRPPSPATTASGLPPTSVASTGRPLAIASSKAFEKPSVSEGRRKRSAAARRGRGSSSSPAKTTLPARPRRPARPSRAARSGPSPTRVSSASTPSAVADARASRANS